MSGDLCDCKAALCNGATLHDMQIATECYQCRETTACDDPLNMHSPDVTKCHAYVSNTCMTTYVQPDSQYNSGKPFTIRGCTDPTFPRGSMDESKCYDNSSSHVPNIPKTYVRQCYCDTDLCNGAYDRNMSSRCSTKKSLVSMYVYVLVAACLAVVVFRR